MLKHRCRSLSLPHHTVERHQLVPGITNTAIRLTSPDQRLAATSPHSAGHLFFSVSRVNAATTRDANALRRARQQACYPRYPPLPGSILVQAASAFWQRLPSRAAAILYHDMLRSPVPKREKLGGDSPNR